jgi:hypothetical protein
MPVRFSAAVWAIVLVGAAAALAQEARPGSARPDLSGVWVGGGGEGITPDQQGNITVLTKGRPCHPGQQCEPAVNFERDSGVRQRMNPNLPLYRPEHWARVEYLDVHGNREDPEMHCKAPGVPRLGAPGKIVQTANEVILLYQSHNTFRVIPTDGREHDPIRSQDLTWQGDSVGTWQGDTLVIDTVGFNDESWLAWPGYFHSNEMRVVETLRREGNTLIWQATVHDPKVLLEPWRMTAQRRTLNPNPKALLTEDLPCEERDVEHLQTRERG